MRPTTIASLDLVHARVSPRTVWSFLRLRTADGTPGLGECTLLRDVEGLAAPFRVARAALLGAELETALALPCDDPATAIATAAIASAVEQAGQDIAARHAGIGVAQRLATTPATHVALYANINRRTTDRSPAGFAASAAAAIAAGYSAFKIAPFDDVNQDNVAGAAGRALLDAALARVAAVRNALAPAHELFVDCHWRFTPATAAGIGDELAALGVTWYECPFAESIAAIPALKSLRARANARGMRLAGLEELPAPAAFGPYLAAGAYDVVMPDVKYAGGIAGLRAVAAAARRHGIACAPHNPTGPVCHAASLAACAADALPLLEHQFDESPLFFALAGTALPRPAGGTSALPTAPGLGITLELSALPPGAVQIVV
jgi:galactonate dehydratase